MSQLAMTLPKSESKFRLSFERLGIRVCRVNGRKADGRNGGQVGPGYEPCSVSDRLRRLGTYRLRIQQKGRETTIELDGVPLGGSNS